MIQILCCHHNGTTSSKAPPLISVTCIVLPALSYVAFTKCSIMIMSRVDFELHVDVINMTKAYIVTGHKGLALRQIHHQARGLSLQ